MNSCRRTRGMVGLEGLYTSRRYKSAPIPPQTVDGAWNKARVLGESFYARSKWNIYRKLHDPSSPESTKYNPCLIFYKWIFFCYRKNLTITHSFAPLDSIFLHFQSMNLFIYSIDSWNLVYARCFWWVLTQHRLFSMNVQGFFSRKISFFVKNCV